MEKLFNEKGKSFTGYCGVAAVSNVSNVPLSEVHVKFIKLCKKKPTWTGGTHHNERVKVLKYYRVKFQEFKLLGMTLKTFVDQHTVKDTTYIVTTSSHVQVIKNGMVTDQRGTVHISEYWGRNKKLKKTQIKVK